MTGQIYENFDESMFEFIFYDKFNVIRLSKSKKDDDDEENDELIRFPKYPGIIVKTTFVKDEEKGRTFPNKTYFEFNPNENVYDLDKKDKKTISILLKNALVDYIKNNGLNDNFELIEKGIVKKNNSVKYEIKFSEYLSFIISIEPGELETENVSDYLANLPIQKVNKEKAKLSGESSSESSDPWKVELAKSSRAACKTCKQKIEKETIRVGEPSYYQDHLSYKWHHLDCMKNFNENNKLDGIEDLPEKEKELVTSKLLIKKAKKDKNPKELIRDIIIEIEDPDGLSLESEIYKRALKENLSIDKIKQILLEMEDGDEIYRPDQGKIKMI
jgi:hypothetical protein